MVKMVVSDKDGVNLLQSHSYVFQPFFYRADGYSGIYQDAMRGVAKIITIAAAAACEAEETKFVHEFNQLHEGTKSTKARNVSLRAFRAFVPSCFRAILPVLQPFRFSIRLPAEMTLSGFRC